MSYSRIIQIEFNHCDPAGIVFYPRYFEMINSVIENFFADELKYPFARVTMEEGRGVPTVRIETDFTAPSRLGEKVAFTLDVTRLGRASVTFRLHARGGDELRLRADMTLVWTSPEGRAEAWPETVRARLEQHLTKEARP